MRGASARRSTASPARSAPTCRAPSPPAARWSSTAAISTHRQTEADRLALPLDARSLIYGTKSVRGFWLYRWFATTPQQEVGAALAQTFTLVADQTIRIPEGQPMPLPDFADALRMAEASGHGGKPLLALSEG